MGNIISALIAAIATVLIVAFFGIPMTTSLAILVAFIIINDLVYIIGSHVKEKKMPSIIQWVQYAFEVLGLILVVCGINYANMISAVCGVIAIIVAFICVLIRKKKEKAEAAATTETTTETTETTPEAESTEESAEQQE